MAFRRRPPHPGARGGRSGQLGESARERRTPPAPAPQADRGRSPDAGGADLLAAGEPLHPAAGRGLGGAPGRLGDPGRGGRPARLRPGELVGREARWSSRSGRASVRPRGAGGVEARGQHPRLRGLGPGIADSLWRVAEAGADNVRFLRRRRGLVPGAPRRPGQPHELWTFFPDPWHKTSTTSAAWSPRPMPRSPPRLEPGGVWRLATDWADYADRWSRCSTPSRCSKGTGRALGRASGHPVRAQGSREGTTDHRPGLHPQARGVMTTTQRPSATTHGGIHPAWGSRPSRWPR